MRDRIPILLKLVCAALAIALIARVAGAFRHANPLAAVEVPVTLKIRTGPDPANRNGVRIARIAEDSGIAALAVHGRTRADRFLGRAEYATIAAIRRAVAIPVIANGDIDSPQAARAVLEATGADAVMVGRAAQGRPWIFAEIAAYLATGQVPAPPSPAQVGDWLLGHLDGLYALYGEPPGVRIARKHIGWYCRSHAGAEAFWRQVSGIEQARAQRDAVAAFFAALADPAWSRAA